MLPPAPQTPIPPTTTHPPRLHLSRKPVKGGAVEAVLATHALGGERGAQQRVEQERRVALRLAGQSVQPLHHLQLVADLPQPRHHLQRRQVCRAAAAERRSTAWQVRAWQCKG